MIKRLLPIFNNIIQRIEEFIICFVLYNIIIFQKINYKIM